MTFSHYLVYSSLLTKRKEGKSSLVPVNIFSIMHYTTNQSVGLLHIHPISTRLLVHLLVDFHGGINFSDKGAGADVTQGAAHDA